MASVSVTKDTLESFAWNVPKDSFNPTKMRRRPYALHAIQPAKMCALRPAQKAAFLATMDGSWMLNMAAATLTSVCSTPMIARKTLSALTVPALSSV